MMKELTISNLIAILQSIHDNVGDLPVCVLDADTGWEIPIRLIAQTGDDVILIDSIGYEDDDRIRNPQQPLVTHWRADD